MFVEMGLGKTIMVLNALDVMIRCGDVEKFLVIAPLRVARTTWIAETKKWDHLNHIKIVSITGNQKERLEALKTDADGYCINYENLPWLAGLFRNKKWPFKTIIADESSKLKSHRSHWRALKTGGNSLVCTGGLRTSSLAPFAFKNTRRFWNLTGTPASKGLDDLWGQQFFIDGGQSLGNTYGAFDSRWFRTDPFTRIKEMFAHSEGEIRKAIAPTTFALRAKDYMELGEELVNTIYVDLPPKARMQYNQMEEELCIEIENGEVEAFNAGAKTMKVHQIANGFIIHGEEGEWEALHDAKLDALADIVEEAAGMPILVCYTFKADLARLKKAFPQGVAFDTKPKTEAAFKAGKIPILFIHPASGGHGVDGFQDVTNIIVFFSVDWSWELHAQVTARIGAVRQLQAGFKRPVFIHQIIAKDTVDEDILNRLESKMTIENALKRGLAKRGLK
jgi:SNF2 family DNA or RNA helicase